MELNVVTFIGHWDILEGALVYGQDKGKTVETWYHWSCNDGSTWPSKVCKIMPYAGNRWWESLLNWPRFKPCMGKLNVPKLIDQLRYNQPVIFYMRILLAAIKRGSRPCRENTMALWERFPQQHWLCWWGESSNCLSCDHRFQERKSLHLWLA